MFSDAINISDMTNWDAHDSNIANYKHFVNTAHAIQKISETKAIVAWASVKLWADPAQSNFDAQSLVNGNKIYFKLIDFSGTEPVVLDTYEYINSNHLGAVYQTFAAGNFQFVNGEVLFSWSLYISSLPVINPVFDDGRSSYRGNGLLAIRLAVINDEITLVYNKMSQHPSTKTGWATYQFRLIKVSDTLAIKDASGGTSYTEEFDLSTGLPVNGTENASSIWAQGVLGNFSYVFQTDGYYRYTIVPKTYDNTKRSYPPINGVTPVPSYWWLINNKVYLMNGTRPLSNIFEYTVDAGGLLVASQIYSIPLEYKDYTSRYVNNLGVREDYENLSLFGPLRTFWKSTAGTYQLAVSSTGELGMCFIHAEAQHGEYPTICSGPVVFHDLLPSNASYPYNVDPALSILGVGADWDGLEYGSLMSEVGWNGHMSTGISTWKVDFIGGKYVFLGFINTNNPSRYQFGMGVTVLFTATP